MLSCSEEHGYQGYQMKIQSSAFLYLETRNERDLAILNFEDDLGYISGIFHPLGGTSISAICHYEYS